jgi:hypothetical protein
MRSRVCLFSSLSLVLITFSGLIRHGKHHHHALNHPDSTDKARREQSHTPTQALHDTAYPAVPASRQAAEIIVTEEREAKSKMPTYSGLEGFKLIEEMGVLVFPFKIYVYLA